MYYEDLSVEDEYVSKWRVITGTDLDLMTSIAGVSDPAYFDHDQAVAQGFEGRRVFEILPVALALGLLYQTVDLEKTTAINAFTHVSYTPEVSCAEGDIVRAVATVTKKEDVDAAIGRIHFDIAITKDDDAVALIVSLCLTWKKRSGAQ